VTLDVATAMDDPQLFGSWFAGASWDGWRAILLAAFVLPMSDAERAFFRLVAERDPPARPVKELWVIAGRRSGKDSIASLIAAHAAALFDGRRLLRGGERPLVLCLACDREQAQIVLGYVRAYFTDVPMLAKLVRRETANGLELSTGVDIAVGTCDYRAVRGRTILACIFDELAFWRQDGSASPDREVYRAIKPGMATLPSSMLIGITSAYRRFGLAYDRWQRCYGRDDKKVLVIRAESRALNPTLDQAEIDEALADDPQAARAEWLSEWRDDLVSYISRDLLDAAVDRGVTVRPPLPGLFYRSFCDPSGGVSDSFTAAVAHAEGETAMLDWAIEVKAPFVPAEAVAQIAAVLRSYHQAETTADRDGAAWVVDAFARHGIMLKHSERDRSAIYVEALPLFSGGRVRLLDNDRIVAQFAALERRAMPGGRDRVDHPQRGGGADDLCNSVAGALVSVMSVTAADAWIADARQRAEQAQRTPEQDLDEQIQQPRLPWHGPAAQPQSPRPAAPGSDDLMQIYLGIVNGSGAAPPRAPLCSYCRRQTIGGRVTDGVRSWCDQGCQAAWVRALAARQRSRERMELGLPPLPPAAGGQSGHTIAGRA
jgi:hypothetical protein